MHLLKELGQIGAYGPSVDVKYGGGGMDETAYGVIMQELERGDSGIRSMASVQSSLVMYPIEKFGSEEQPRLITGGVVPKSAPTQPIGCYFPVSSIDESSIKIQALGGAVFVPKTVVPGKGFYACCMDPEDNYFVIWENDEKAA